MVVQPRQELEKPFFQSCTTMPNLTFCIFNDCLRQMPRAQKMLAMLPT